MHRSHDYAILIFSVLSFFEFLVSAGRGAPSLTRGSGLDDGQTLLGSLVAVAGGLDVPNVCFEGVTAATDAHLGDRKSVV